MQIWDDVKYFKRTDFFQKLFSLALVINVVRRVVQDISSANQGNQIACYLMECNYEQQLQGWKRL